MATRSRVVWHGSIGYVIIMVAVALVMISARGCAIDTFGTAKARDDWNEWRDDVNQQADKQWKGPVRRKPLQHDEPPALTLMRDHFAACLTYAILLSSVIYLTLMYSFRGVLFTKRGMGSQDEHGQ